MVCIEFCKMGKKEETGAQERNLEPERVVLTFFKAQKNSVFHRCAQLISAFPFSEVSGINTTLIFYCPPLLSAHPNLHSYISHRLTVSFQVFVNDLVFPICALSCPSKLKLLWEAVILNFKNFFSASPTFPAPDNSINIVHRLKRTQAPWVLPQTHTP